MPCCWLCRARRGPHAEGCQQLLEAGEGSKMGSLEPPDGKMRRCVIVSHPVCGDCDSSKRK